MKCGVPKTARCSVELPRANHERLCRRGDENAEREMKLGGSYQADGAAHVHDLVRIEEVIEGGLLFWKPCFLFAPSHLSQYPVVQLRH